MIQPVFDKGLDVSRQFVQVVRARSSRKLSETHQDRYTEGHISSGVVSLGEPYNVAFDRFADPACANSIHSGRADEITVEHNNLLSEIQSKEIIARLV